MKNSQPNEVSTPVAPVKKVKLTPLESWIVLIGLVLGLGTIWSQRLKQYIKVV